MSTWTIDKQFSFCYGHRVWSQKLNHEYCEQGDYKTKCRALHGHEGLVHVFLESTYLQRGMVTDFKHLGWLKNFLDTYVDHKFIVDLNDPLFHQMVQVPFATKYVEHVDHIGETELQSWLFPSPEESGVCATPVIVPETDFVVGYTVNTEHFKDSPEKEYLEGFLIVKFVPTSENLSQWLFDLIQVKMNKLGVNVTRVDWNETPKSRASYMS